MYIVKQRFIEFAFNNMSIIEIHNSLRKYLPEVMPSLLETGLPGLVVTL